MNLRIWLVKDLKLDTWPKKFKTRPKLRTK